MDSTTDLIQKMLQQKNVVTLDLLIISLILASIAGLIIAKFYERFGSSLSNRRSLSKNFVILCVTTTLVITVIKGSITLSLGLVGALSIVRFRTAIKEPEELAYLFLVIAAGIGMGAGVPTLTFTALIIILTIIYIDRVFVSRSKNLNENNMFLSVKLKKYSNGDFDRLVDKLTSEKINLKRFEKSGDSVDIVFLINAMSKADLGEIEALANSNQNIEFNLVEQTSIH